MPVRKVWGLGLLALGFTSAAGKQPIEVMVVELVHPTP